MCVVQYNLLTKVNVSNLTCDIPTDLSNAPDNNDPKVDDGNDDD